jgi:CheY-like chemotaxis protein
MIDRNFTILVAEDNPSDQKFLACAWGEVATDAELHFVRDGIELLEALREPETAAADAPDLIMLDLNMPRMNGVEALRELKDDPRLNGIPVVVFSSSSAEADVDRAYAAGANSFMTKPMTYDELVSMLETVKRYWFDLAQLPHGNSLVPAA